ncbi:MFS general substrate transporter [Cucurbitaria berberidis CBS 394.84]|uniref:MFS general substrate transporter n=1 Tax=Cucurbitaria berberidis CBS 394.84 TaxID=1168544 RepID=A0A9P4GEM7_9PLEO|nr:MFS general substrate transporter [Cucurbitaria berberidis CBS 394.84]KAF1844155.1 MFS general substrate transporter [Cucurbitaria berberidis CBS 394.84]
MSSSPATISLQGSKIILEEHTSRSSTAYAWSQRKKWILLTMVAFCQVSMNFNAAVYSNAVEGINTTFGISNARLGMVAFLIPYAIGCELWAPWSEEFGRWPIMQASLSLTNISILLCALAKNFGLVIGGRVMGGLSSAGGSVTMGMVADMFSPEDQQYAVLWASLFSCLGAVFGGIGGGPIQQYLPWRWNFWIQLIFGVATQVLHLAVAKESRATILLDLEAKRQRKLGASNVYGPDEVRSWKERLHPREIMTTICRPFQMLLFEPIVLFLSLLSGFADALIFSFFESYAYVFQQWSFTPTHISLALVALAASYVIGYFTFFPVIARHNARRSKGEQLSPEARLKPLLFHVVLLPVGLLICAFVATGPPLHWAGVIIASVIIGIANFAIYYTTIDYMVAAYGPYSASATGGNGFMRDFLAGLCALYTGPLYHRLGIRNAYLVLFGLAVLFCIPVYVFYFQGARIRARSKFASELASKKEEQSGGNDGIEMGDGVLAISTLQEV